MFYCVIHTSSSTIARKMSFSNKKDMEDLQAFIKSGDTIILVDDLSSLDEGINIPDNIKII